MGLRMRLRARKFEHNRIERSVRQQQYNKRKIQDQTEDSVKRRDPGIQKLARSYNKHAPWNAVAPLPIALKGLFNLDVDDNIWEDIGLNDDDDEGPPPWLSSERVRKDIKGILLRDRSDEELRRLQHEMRAMREWMREEWELLLRAIDGVKVT
ncbi:hypothetical protein DFH05DRAFT_1460546 [Lentinula detonsa]|uniref:Uncharacterized protein n=1 Tax=Lentinula detonsa TaxID=2804962 RepID=A0A9W8P0I3_9AGAR|nr:hypothetical protein DFH05DRAFT_1460546 [Lentinula detonsa]